MNYEVKQEEGLETSADMSRIVSETELFSYFAELKIEKNLNIAGAEKLRIHSYCPVDCLIDLGAYGQLEDLSDTVYDRLISSTEPEFSLFDLIEDLEVYLSNLKKIRDDFCTLKEGCRVEFVGGPEPQDPELRLAWEAAWEQYEEVPRFRIPEQTNNLEFTR
ncbi:MAG: hypothetical protein ACTHLT_05800 [Devosia sp.]